MSKQVPVLLVESKSTIPQLKSKKQKRKKKNTANVPLAAIALMNGSKQITPKRSRQPKLAVVRNAGASVAQAYLNTLNAPFKYPGINIGFGCLIPTMLNSVYVKGSFNVNATDGTFRVNTLPWTLNPTNNGTIVNIANLAASVAQTYSPIAAADGGLLNNMAGFARVVSGGLRVFVKYAATAQGGIMNAFTIPTNSSTPTTLSFNTALSLPQARMSNTDSCSVYYRPTDFNDYEFYSLTSAGATSTLASFQGYIDGTGYPTGATVYYEACYHLETYSTVTSSAADIASDTDWPTLASTYSNIETAMQKIRPYLTPEIVQGGVDWMFGDSMDTVNKYKRSRGKQL